MRLLVLLAVAVTVAAAAEITRGKPDLDKEWQDFKGKHGKKYKNSAEEAERRKIWGAKRDRVAKHNQEAAAGLHTYKMAINTFSDFTPAELANLARTIKKPAGKPRAAEFSTYRNESDSSRIGERQTTSVDLRSDPCMPPIKDQNPCGSCWAFAAVTPVEWALCKKTNNLVLFSEQQLVSCAGSYGASGCEGGDYPYAWKYIKDNGLAKSSDYPYTAKDGVCSYSKSQSAATVTGHVSLGPGVTESKIRAAIDQNGPVAAALHYVEDTFLNYGSGIYTDSTCSTDGKKMDHAVVLVGYGSINGMDYWILRNSWATNWGDKGYMLIRRGTNECNIESDVAYPTFGDVKPPSAPSDGGNIDPDQPAEEVYYEEILA